MTKADLKLTAVITSIVLSVMVGGAAYFWNVDDDFRLGVKVAANDAGFNFDLTEELRPKPPKIGHSQNQVTRYCGGPDGESSTETAGGRHVTLRYERRLRAECQGSYSFVNDRLVSIYRNER